LNSRRSISPPAGASALTRLILTFSPSLYSLFLIKISLNVSSSGLFVVVEKVADKIYLEVNKKNVRL